MGEKQKQHATRLTAFKTLQDPKNLYECPDCGHETANPEPDDEGDRICEECGCILAEKVKYDCEKCEHENVDPEQNEDGEYICEECGEVMDVEVS